MLMIVAHHFVVCSGINSQTGPLQLEPDSIKSILLRLYGMWGKTGVNCFLMITGYYMCTSKITIKKYLKLLLEVVFYNVVFYMIFLASGYETLSLSSIAKSVLPVWGFGMMFTSCFLAFYLFIPFLSLLVQSMSKQQHLLLILLLSGCYTLLASIPGFDVSFNYITWFGIIFIIASYIRLYPSTIFENRVLWGWISLGAVALSIISVFVFQSIIGSGYFLVSDSNKILAVAVAVSSFLWFKNLKLRHSKIINALGASTFGVLLIHSNSRAMRTWLWKDTIDVIGHYTLPLGQLILFCIGVVLLVFIVCSIIDYVRILLLEKPFFKWYDKSLDLKINSYIDRVLCQKSK